MRFQLIILFRWSVLVTFLWELAVKIRKRVRVAARWQKKKAVVQWLYCYALLRRLWKNRAAVSFCEKQKPDDPHAISRGGILGGCRHVCVSGSQYPWVTSVKKSLAPPPGHYVFISVLSICVNQYNHRFSCRASIPLWGAGVFACRFLDRRAVCYRCRSPPPFDSPVNYPWIEMEVHDEKSQSPGSVSRYL